MINVVFVQGLYRFYSKYVRANGVKHRYISAGINPVGFQFSQEILCGINPDYVKNSSSI